MKILNFLIVTFMTLASWQIQAKEPQVERVGGSYVISKIDRQNDGNFEIQFKSAKPNGVHDTLVLLSDHVHIGLEEGKEVRLSAEILEKRPEYTEVSQVMVILPRKDSQASNPIWLLSNRVSHEELKGAKYLEMHAPASDFVIF
jgi:hypothetical protein